MRSIIVLVGLYALVQYLITQHSNHIKQREQLVDNLILSIWRDRLAINKEYNAHP